jgi:RNA exonuclease 4
MLSHPRAQIRDTQLLAHKHGQSRATRPALRTLVRDMLGATIQAGEHSSVCISPCFPRQIYLLNPRCR